jgi:glutamyl-tRNA reductase
MTAMHVVLLGTSHHVAPLEAREALAFTPTRAGEIAARLAALGGEAVALATCNRVCLYLADADPERAVTRGLRELGVDVDTSRWKDWLFVKRDGDAARHLFRVAAGLDSLVPGEAQILGQVRAAYDRAADAGAVGPVLHRLFRDAIQTGRRARNETSIGENPSSVSAAAAELATRVFDDLPSRRVLVIGAGKAGELVARNLVSRGVTELVVANRSADRATALTTQLGGRAISLADVPGVLADVDVVISSTGTDGYVLSADSVKAALPRRRGEPIFFVDIAVPRDIDPAVNDLPGCYLYDIDDLGRVVEESMAARRGEARHAEAIVDEAGAAYERWLHYLDAVPAIAELRSRAEQIRLAELARARAALSDLSPRERVAVETLASGIVNKLLHVPTVRLKEAAASTEGAAYLDTVRDLFGLTRERQA